MTLGAAFDASVAALRHAAADVPTVLSPADISELLHGARNLLRTLRVYPDRVANISLV